MKEWTGLIQLMEGPVASSFEDCSEPSGYLKVTDILTISDTIRLLKRIVLCEVWCANRTIFLFVLVIVIC
jgi:hypothetical protein